MLISAGPETMLGMYFVRLEFSVKQSTINHPDYGIELFPALCVVKGGNVGSNYGVLAYSDLRSREVAQECCGENCWKCPLGSSGS